MTNIPRSPGNWYLVLLFRHQQASAAALPGPVPLHLPRRSSAHFPGCPPTHHGAQTHGTHPPSGPCVSASRSRETSPASTLRGAREYVSTVGLLRHN